MKKIHQIPGQVTFGRAIGDFFKGYFDFKGRTTRAGYWWVALILILLTFIGATSFLPIIIFAGLQSGVNQGQSLGGLLIYVIISLIIFLGLLSPSIALAVRRYRDAGLRGRGFLVFWILSMAASYTNLTQNLNSLSAISTMDSTVYSQPTQFGSTFITFIGYAISVSFFVITLLPTDMLTTTTKNKFVRFFLREKENDETSQTEN